MDQLRPLRWPDALVSSANRPDVRQRFDEGRYVRLVGGWYVETGAWIAAARHVRFEWTMAARTARSPGSTLCGESALMAMGLPVAGAPEAIQLAEPSHSRSGAWPDTFSARGPRAAEAAAAWRPVVHRHVHPHDAQHHTGVYRCVSPLDAAVEVMSRLPLLRALPVADALAVHGPALGAGPAEVGQALEGLEARVRRERLSLAWESRNALSGSVGESTSRAVMVEHGFEVPVLQQEFWDGRGLVGYCDFCWPGARVIGEFDGKLKYDGTFGASRSADQVFGQEKARENRLTALGYRVVRWGWADVQRPRRLVRLLTAAGVPRRAAGR